MVKMSEKLCLGGLSTFNNYIFCARPGILSMADGAKCSSWCCSKNDSIISRKNGV